MYHNNNGPKVNRTKGILAYNIFFRKIYIYKFHIIGKKENCGGTRIHQVGQGRIFGAA